MPLPSSPLFLRALPVLAMLAGAAHAADPVEFSVDFLDARAGMGIEYVGRDETGKADLVGVDTRGSNEPSSVSHRYRLLVPLSERWQLGGEYFSVSGTDSGKIKKRFQLGPFNPFVVSISTDQYDLDVYRVWGGYAVYLDETTAFQLRGGLVVMSATLAAESPVLERDSVSGVAPLPMLGMRMTHRDTFGLKWSLALDYASSPVRDISGGMRSVDASVEYPLADWVGVGLGYMAHKLEVDNRRTDRDISLSHGLSSPYLFLTARF